MSGGEGPHGHSALCPCLLGASLGSASVLPSSRSLHLAFWCPHLCLSPSALSLVIQGASPHLSLSSLLSGPGGSSFLGFWDTCLSLWLMHPPLLPLFTHSLPLAGSLDEYILGIGVRLAWAPILAPSKHSEPHEPSVQWAHPLTWQDVQVRMRREACEPSPTPGPCTFPHLPLSLPNPFPPCSSDVWEAEAGIPRGKPAQLPHSCKCQDISTLLRSS